MYQETRGTRNYVYRSVRVGKTVRKIYLGRGAHAKQLMAQQELSRVKKAQEERAAAEEEAMLWPLQQRARLLKAEVKQILVALHLSTNHYRSRCRHWRRRRMDTPIEQLSVVGPGESESGQPDNQAEARQNRDSELKMLCDQIRAGKNHLRPRLRALLLQEKPEDIDRIGDVSRYAVDQWSRLLAPKNPVAREAIAVKAMQERDALAPAGSSSYVERLVADRLVVARLSQTFHELRMTALADQVDAAGSKFAISQEKRLLASNRELRQAIKDYQKAVSLKAEISPPTTQAGVAALKIFNPDSKRKSA